MYSQEELEAICAEMEKSAREIADKYMLPAVLVLGCYDFEGQVYSLSGKTGNIYTCIGMMENLKEIMLCGRYQPNNDNDIEQ